MAETIRDPHAPRAPLRVLLGYLPQHRRALSVVVVLSVVGAGLSLGQPLLVNRLVESVGSGRPLGGLIALLLGLVIGAGLLDAARQYLLERTAERVVLSSRRQLVAKLMQLPVAVHDAHRAGDLVSRVGSDTTMVRSALTGGLVDALGGTVVFVGSLVGMAVLDPVLLGITLAVVAVAVISVVLATARIQTLTLAAQESLGRLGAGVERAVSAIRTIKASGATTRESARLDEEATAAYSYGVQVARIEATLSPVSGLAVQGSFLAVLGVGGYRVANGSTSVADLVTFIFFLFMMVMPLAQFFSAVTTVRTALGALARIHEVLDLPSEADPRGMEARTGTDLAWRDPRPAPAHGVELVFDQVTFGYEPSKAHRQDRPRRQPHPAPPPPTAPHRRRTNPGRNLRPTPRPRPRHHHHQRHHR